MGNHPVLSLPLKAVLLTLITVLLTGIKPADAVRPSKAKPCATDLDSCPTRGCAQPGSADALLNELKRTRPAMQTAIPLTLDDFATLQDQSDDLVGQNVSLTKTIRNKLRRLSTSAGQVNEGDLVAVVGYMVGVPHANKSGESVNCRLKGRDNNDFHIPIARSSNDTEFDAIVVEMIPQKRPAGWTETKLKRMAKEERPVLVRGQLFYDNKHLVNADPDEAIGGQPKRFSIWEIHPVTEFFVCMSPNRRCDPRDIGTGWKALADLPE